jgi:hypothetical protein
VKAVAKPYPDQAISRRQLLAALAATEAGSIASRTAAQSPPPGDAVASRPGDRLIKATLDDDGSAGAPVGTPQMPHLLDGYAARPPWKVAGVDYAVGVPASTVLTDWRTLRMPNVTLGANSIRISADNVVLDGVDFSSHNGAYVAIDAVANATIQNCRFGGPSLQSLSTGIIDSRAANLTVRNCVFDAAGAGTAACVLFIRKRGNVTLIYNYIDNFPSQIIELQNGGILDYRFNLIGEGARQPGAHMNYLEFEAGAATPTVAFNTTAQTARAASGGEGFQFYFNRGGTMIRPICANNTMIARCGHGMAVMSYLLHGSVHATLTGMGLVGNNYFDVSSAYGAFYPRSFPNWRLSGNIDMVSGLAIPAA